MWYVVDAIVFFAAGWAFFKHRAYVKQQAINKVQSIEDGIKAKL